ncbi:MAG: integration host factor subunit alpha [Hyphomicrobiaceae bacterium]
MSSRTVTRADLSDAVQEELGVSRQDAAEIVETVLALVGDALVEGDSVKLSSFGAFSVRDKGGRVGRNPKTNEEVPIAPRRVLSFKPSQILKERVDGGEA